MCLLFLKYVSVAWVDSNVGFLACVYSTLLKIRSLPGRDLANPYTKESAI